MREFSLAILVTCVAAPAAFGEEPRATDAEALEFIEGRIREILDVPEAARIEALIALLGSDRWDVRLAATALLDTTGSAAIAPLRAATFSQDPEIRRRAEALLASRRPAPPAGPIDARVAAVHPTAQLVMLDRGADHGVENGMAFTVYSGSKYKATCTVTTIFHYMAAASLDPKLLMEMPVEGDAATTRIR